MRIQTRVHARRAALVLAAALLIGLWPATAAAQEVSGAGQGPGVQQVSPLTTTPPEAPLTQVSPQVTTPGVTGVAPGAAPAQQVPLVLPRTGDAETTVSPVLPVLGALALAAGLGLRLRGRAAGRLKGRDSVGR